MIADPSIVSRIQSLFERYGSLRYGTEAVTQLQHGLQSASWARQSAAPRELQVAALLHDIGHLLVADNGGRPPRADGVASLDDGHESWGHQWLQQYFGPAVVDPIRLHVAAKRYLCTIDPTYEAQLSETSRRSFHDQGGPMDDSERVAFEREPYYREALELRRWDDLAKDPAKQTPGLDGFLADVRSLLQ